MGGGCQCVGLVADAIYGGRQAPLLRQHCRCIGRALQINMTAGKTPTLVARFRQIGDLIVCFVKEARGSFFLVQAPGSLRSQPIL